MKRKAFSREFHPDGISSPTILKLSCRVLNSKRMNNLTEDEVKCVCDIINGFIGNLKESKKEIIENFKSTNNGTISKNS